jgi:hypothetical protein
MKSGSRGVLVQSKDMKSGSRGIFVHSNDMKSGSRGVVVAPEQAGGPLSKKGSS